MGKRPSVCTKLSGVEKSVTSHWPRWTSSAADEYDFLAGDMCRETGSQINRKCKWWIHRAYAFDTTPRTNQQIDNMVLERISEGYDRRTLWGQEQGDMSWGERMGIWRLRDPGSTARKRWCRHRVRNSPVTEDNSTSTCQAPAHSTDRCTCRIYSNSQPLNAIQRCRNMGEWEDVSDVAAAGRALASWGLQQDQSCRQTEWLAKPDEWG